MGGAFRDALDVRGVCRKPGRGVQLDVMSRPTPPCVLAFAMFLAVPGASAANDQILARVDGQPIYAWDAEHFVSAEADGRVQRPRRCGTRLNRESAEAELQRVNRNARNLENRVERKLLLAECRRTGRATSDGAVLREVRARFPYERDEVNPGLGHDLSADVPIPRPAVWRHAAHTPTEPEIEATRERLCLDRLLTAEATAPIRRAEARAWYLAHPVEFAVATPLDGGAWVFLPFERARRAVERSMRAEGPAATRARIVDRLRLRAKIERGA